MNLFSRSISYIYLKYLNSFSITHSRQTSPAMTHFEWDWVYMTTITMLKRKEDKHDFCIDHQNYLRQMLKSLWLMSFNENGNFESFKVAGGFGSAECSKNILYILRMGRLAEGWNDPPSQNRLRLIKPTWCRWERFPWVRHTDVFTRCEIYSSVAQITFAATEVWFVCHSLVSNSPQFAFWSSAFW